MEVERVKMSETEEKLCFKFNYPKKFLCGISLETGALVLALITILASTVHIGVASYFISLGADVTNFGELVDGSKEEVYRITFSFYIYEGNTKYWEHWAKLNGVDVALSLLALILAIVGLVGVLKRKPTLVLCLVCAVWGYIGFWIGKIFGTAAFCDDFTISPGLAWTLTIALGIALVVLFYFPICVESLYYKLRKEEKEKQVRQTKSLAKLTMIFKVGGSEMGEANF